MGKIINGKLHEMHGDGLYHEIPLGLDAARSAKGQPSRSYAVDERTGRPHLFISDLDGFAKDRAENGGMVYTAVPKGGGDARRFVGLDQDIAYRSGDHLETVGATGFLDVTDPASTSVVSGPDFNAGYDVTGRETTCPGARTMVLRFEKGKENEILGGRVTPLHDVDVPVAVLFNENSSAGEVMPLKDVQVHYISGKTGEAASYDYRAGENVAASMADLTDPMVVGGPGKGLQPGGLAARFLASLDSPDDAGADSSQASGPDAPDLPGE